MNLFKKYSLLIAIILLLISLLIPIKLVGLILSLVILGITFVNPKNGLIFLLVYFPLRPFIIEMNEGLKYLGDFIILGLFVYVILINFRNWKSFVNNWIFIVGFLGFCLIGAIAGLITGVSISAIIFQLRAFIITFLLFFIVKGLKITKRDLMLFLWTTVLVALLLCIQGIVEKVSNRTLFLPEAWANVWMPETNRIRIYSLIGNPNVFATYLVFAFFISFYLRKFYPKFKILLGIISVLFFGVFLLTYSRGTIIALVIGLIIYILTTRNWKILKFIAISAIISIPLIYYPVIGLTDYVGKQMTVENTNQSGTSGEDKVNTKNNKEGFSKRMSEAFSGETVQQSMEWGRLFVVVRGFEIFKDNPIIGTGFGTYGDSASLTYSSPITEKYKLPEEMYSDNQYIQVIVQTGILGVLFFAAFILGMGRILWKMRQSNKLSLPLLAFLIGGFVAGVFYNIWEDKTFTLYYFIILGFLLNTDFNKKGKELI